MKRLWLYERGGLLQSIAGICSRCFWASAAAVYQRIGVPHELYLTSPHLTLRGRGQYEQ